MSKKYYLNWEEVNINWEELNVNWEDVYQLIAGSSHYRGDNPWDKPWNKPEWRTLSDSEKTKILENFKNDR
jgi:hypothetical protein